MVNHQAETAITKRSKTFSIIVFSLILLLVISLLPFYYYLTRAAA